MTSVDIIRVAKGEGVVVTLSPSGTIMATGERSAVERWRLILSEHKVEIVRHLSGGVALQPLPAWCRAECPALETISGAGPGCVQRLVAGPWLEEWRLLSLLTACRRVAIFHQEW